MVGELAASGRPARVRHALTGIELVLVPESEAWLGARLYDPDRTVSEPLAQQQRIPAFYFGALEVSRAAFAVFGAETGHRVPAQPSWGDATHPVVYVDRGDAERLAAWMLVRLPTDDEWEYAARAGGEAIYGASDRAADVFGVANVLDRSGAAARPRLSVSGFEFDDGWPQSAPVGSFRANAWRIHDALGNVAEWTSSNAASGEAVVRGGAWSMGRLECRVSARSLLSARTGQGFVGIRLAAAVEELVLQ